ncbi:hypothetical protein DVA86_22375 [Streptomyces armeniacus]|uniref:Uncharacterized protein n=1 Tax=Streptomyces armeniacus TaxID=83291 RepID=A0A345XTL5_9ACTN|nr:hypothetical protein DVA86_22375 [Streptomyces armeniacus]
MGAVPVRWRYLAVGLGFLGLAGVRAAQGAPVWAAVFCAAAVANGWLAVHEAREAGRTAAEPPAVARLEALDAAELDRALAACRTSARQWHVLAAVGVLVGAVLLAVQPATAVLAGAAALFALHRARRAAHAAATLRRARAVRP